MSGRKRALVGAGAWLAWLVAVRPTPRSEEWAEALVLLAALVIVPLGAPLAGVGARIAALQPYAAFPLLVSMMLPRGVAAAALCLPWLGAALVSAVAVERPRTPSAVALVAGVVLLPVGAAWLVLARWGLRPLGFSDPIVLLTAVHFHYAGFALPVVLGAALACVDRPQLARAAVTMVVLGVPLVALGITATQLGRSERLEPIAAWTMSLGGLLTAWVLVLTRRASLIVAAVFLGFGMLLAALYGARSFVPLLDIPWMRALHGSANALGFALLSLVALSATNDAGRTGAQPKGADEDGDGDEARGEGDGEGHDDGRYKSHTSGNN